MSHNQNFSDDASVNGLLKNGQWCDKDVGVVVAGMTLGDLKIALVEQYLLESGVSDRLVICLYTGTGQNKKSKYICEDGDAIPTQDALTLGGYTLMVRSKKGDEREIDTTCDSKFMEMIMPEVGRAIREQYHWVPFSIPIFLYLDNAGGHGTKAVIDQYVKALKDDFNVILVHQRPRSPATNMLDLGVWMALQNVVEKLHFRKRMEAKALCNTVEEAWKQLDSIKLQNVYNRWKMVLDLIIEDNGGDRLIEAKRGKLYRAPSPEMEDLDEDRESRDVNDDKRTQEDIDVMDQGLDTVAY